MTSIEAFTREHGLGRWLNQLLEMGDDRDELSEGLTGDEFEHFVESCGMPAPDAGIYRRLPARTARPPAHLRLLSACAVRESDLGVGPHAVFAPQPPPFTAAATTVTAN